MSTNQPTTMVFWVGSACKAVCFCMWILLGFIVSARVCVRIWQSVKGHRRNTNNIAFSNNQIQLTLWRFRKLLLSRDEKLHIVQCVNWHWQSNNVQLQWWIWDQIKQLFVLHIQKLLADADTYSGSLLIKPLTTLAIRLPVVCVLNKCWRRLSWENGREITSSLTNDVHTDSQNLQTWSELVVDGGSKPKQKYLATHTHTALYIKYRKWHSIYICFQGIRG